MGASTSNTILGEGSTAAPGFFQNFVSGIQQLVNNIGTTTGIQPAEPGSQGNAI